MLTLEQFRLTGRRVDDISEEIGAEVYDAQGEPCVKAAYVYEGGLYIEIEADGTLSLQLMRDSYCGSAAELPDLEQHLYKFGLEEGAFT